MWIKAIRACNHCEITAGELLAAARGDLRKPVDYIPNEAESGRIPYYIYSINNDSINNVGIIKMRDYNNFMADIETLRDNNKYEEADKKRDEIFGINGIINDYVNYVNIYDLYDSGRIDYCFDGNFGK